jgi:hypothetical protein
MRLNKLTAAIAAAGTTLAVAPAAALAAPPHHGVKALKHAHLGKCHLSLSADPHFATTGESVLVTGVLAKCSGTAVGGQTITISERIAGVPGVKVVGTPTTLANGSYTFTPPALVTDSHFSAAALGAQTAEKLVKVAPQVTVKLPKPEGSQLFTGPANAVTFTGSVSPTTLDEGAEVFLQRESGTSVEEWRTIQRRVLVKSDGSFSIKHTFGSPGDANLRIVIRPHGNFSARGVSDAMAYVISQTQNPSLTLEPKSDPIAYGAPLSLKGVVKGASSQNVVLMGHTFGGVFAKVGETTTDSAGAYEITLASVTQSTRYQALSGAAHSAIVFEGVKWTVLTAGAFTAPSVPATKVPSGTQVTFTGTLAPASREGHGVYLERRSPNGGYHVVNRGTVGTVGKGGTFSIPFDVAGSGKQVYRIKVFGDPINQGSSSSPIELEVTSAVVATPQLQPTLPR